MSRRCTTTGMSSGECGETPFLPVMTGGEGVFSISIYIRLRKRASPYTCCHYLYRVSQRTSIVYTLLLILLGHSKVKITKNNDARWRFNTTVYKDQSMEAFVEEGM